MKAFQAIVCTALLAILSSSAYADYRVDKGFTRTWVPQDIVLTFGQDPAVNPEAACLALTLGQFLRASGRRVNVTLFVRNDGVALADAKTVGSVAERCQTPAGAVSLQDNLEAFLDGNPNNLVNCPICWGARFGAQVPDYGVLDPDAIPPLLLGADKVIDF